MQKSSPFLILLMVLLTCNTNTGSHEDYSGNIYSLQGNSGFSADQLSEDTRLWYKRLMEAATHPDPAYDYQETAASGNLYAYGRHLSMYIHNLLIGLRVTGDLRFLDMIDEITETMREQLVTSYLDIPGGLRDGTSHHRLEFIPDPDDGYLKWLHLRQGSSGPGRTYGTDLNIKNDQLTHSTIAAVTLAYRLNADKPSPGGVDYAARADFWEDYFRNHFEAKWRERHDHDEDEYPLIIQSNDRLHHNNIHQARLHLYSYLLHRLNGRDKKSELDEIQVLIDQMLEDLVEDIPTPDGEASVWPYGVTSWNSGSNDRLMSTTYVRYEVMALVDLFLDGFQEGLQTDIDQEHLARVARSLVNFVDDGDPEDSGYRFAQSIGGDRDRGGLYFDETANARITESRFFTSSYGHLARWDHSGNLDEILEEMYARHEDDPSRPRNTAVPAAMLLKHAPTSYNPREP